MKTKKKVLFSKALFAFAIAASTLACNSLTPSSPIFPEDDLSKVDSGYINVVLPRVTSHNLRETVDPFDKIETLRLAFYDEEGSLNFVRDLAVTEFENGMTQKIKIPVASYQVLAIANANEVYRPTQPLSSFLESVRYKIKEIPNFDDYTDENFGLDNKVRSIPMINSQGVVKLSADEISIDQEGTLHNLKLEIEPCLARVFVAGKPQIIGGTQPTDDAPQYIIDNVPHNLFLMRKLSKLSNGEEEVLGDGSNPSDRYALSAAESDMLANPTEESSAFIGNYAQFFYPSPVLASFDNIDLSFANAYSKELSVAVGKQYPSLVPRLVIRYRYTPNGIEGVQTGDSWLSYKGFYMSLPKFKTYVENPNSAPADLKEAILQLKAEGPISYTKGFSKFGIKFYLNSQSYYVVYVRHFGDDKAPENNSYGRYGIIRNNEYRVKINSISAAGEPVIPKPSSEELVQSQVQINSIINVTQTTVHNQEEDL